MTSKELFIVGVRFVGLWQLVKALDYLLEAFDISTGLFKPVTTTMGACYAHIAVYLATGIYLLGGAPYIIRLVFDRSTDKARKGPTASE